MQKIKGKLAATRLVAAGVVLTADGNQNSTANGSVLNVSATPTAASGRYNAIKCEAYLAPASASPVGCYGIRGLAGVATGKTVSGSSASYHAGVQGKLDVVGALGDGSAGSIYACGVLAQINNGGGTFGSEAQVYGLWVDNQRATGGEALFHMVNITNNGGTVDNIFKVYGNNAVAGAFMDLETLGGTVLLDITGNASKQTKGLLVKLDGVTYYLPLQSAIS